MAYKYRHRETYKGIKIDIKAHTSADLISKVQAKKHAIDSDVIDGSIKLSTYGEVYLKSAKLHSVSASWYKCLEYTWSTIVQDLKDRPLKDVKPINLQNYLNGLNLADSTIKKRYDLICQVFHSAYINGVTDTDYAIQLVRPHGRPTVTGRSITDHERDILLKVLDGHRGELFCKLILYCGLRPSEAQALQWKDLDLKERTVTVDKALKRNGTVGPPKTNAAYRTVPLPDHLARLIRPGEPFDDVFSHNVTWQKRVWENVKREMNIAMGCKVYRNKLVMPYPLADDFTLYNLRHTYCTDLEKAGVPINIASRLMGHSSINVTAKIYTHASTEALEIARRLIDAVGN